MRIYVAIVTVFALPGAAFPAPASEMDLHDGFATALTCEFIEKEDGRGLPEINLSAQQLADAAEAYEPGQAFSEEDVELFRWRAAMPEDCGLYDGENQRFGAYAIRELLSMFNEAAGVTITWKDIADQASGDSCERSEAFWAALVKQEIDPFGDELDRLLSAHPVFGDGTEPAGLAELKIRWRAYWLGRYRERELSDQAVEDYAAAFEAFPEEGNRHDLNFDEIALTLFYTSPEFSAERLAAFGPVSPGGDRGLDLKSYIARQQAWNFLFSGETDFPVRAPDDDRALEFREDLIRHFRGELPGPENCHPVDYWDVRGDYSSILRGVVEFVDEQLLRRLNALLDASSQPEFQRIESGQSMSSIVEPAVDEWSGPDCALPIVRASYRLIPGSPSLSDGLTESGYAYLDSNSPGLEETVLGASIEHGLPDGMLESGWELDADQAELIRREDVVSELRRTVLDRLDLFELNWCEEDIRFPVLPGGYSVTVPIVSAQERETLWLR